MTRVHVGDIGWQLAIPIGSSNGFERQDYDRYTVKVTSKTVILKNSYKTHRLKIKDGKVMFKGHIIEVIS